MPDLSRLSLFVKDFQNSRRAKTVALIILGLLALLVLAPSVINFLRLRALKDKFNCSSISAISNCPPFKCSILDNKCASNSDGKKPDLTTCVQACQDPDGCLCNHLGCYIKQDVDFDQNCGGSVALDVEAKSQQHNAGTATLDRSKANSTETGTTTPQGLCGSGCQEKKDCQDGFICTSTNSDGICWQPACDGLDNSNFDPNASDTPYVQVPTSDVPDCSGITTSAPLFNIHVGQKYEVKVISGSETPVTSVQLMSHGETCQDNSQIISKLDTSGPGTHTFTWTPRSSGTQTLYATISNGQVACTSDCQDSPAANPAGQSPSLCLHNAACKFSINVLP